MEDQKTIEAIREKLIIEIKEGLKGIRHKDVYTRLNVSKVHFNRLLKVEPFVDNMEILGKIANTIAQIKKEKIAQANSILKRSVKKMKAA